MNTYQGSDAAWHALGDPSRRAIVDSLAGGSRSVRELADELPISRPAVSQHLKVLKDAGLVTDRPAGTRRIYQVHAAGVLALRDQLDTYWNRALTAYQDVVEQAESGDEPAPADHEGSADRSGRSESSGRSEPPAPPEGAER